MTRDRSAGRSLPALVALLALCAALCAGLLALAGCGGGEEATGGARGDATGGQTGEAPALSPDDIDALRSLPYASGSSVADGAPDGVTLRDPARSCPGYDLYAIQALSRAELIDAEGTVLRSWSHSPSEVWERCELLPNGDLLVIGAEPSSWPEKMPFRRIADGARYLLRLDWNGETIWKRHLTVHHDIERMPDGKLLTLTFQRRFLPEMHPDVLVRDDQLTLLEPDGTVIESHSLLDAVEGRADIYPLLPVHPDRLGGPPWLDVFHANSVEWLRRPELVGRHPLYAPDNILVCFRHQDRIAVFDWPRNEVVWAWGEGELSGPHDAQVLAGGNLLVFDNGLARGWSRVLELDPVTEEIVWEYRGDPPDSFFTMTKGSAQRLPNGNTLIAESDRGRAFEITPDGEIVWEYLCPHRSAPGERAALVRIRRHPPELIEPLLAAGR